MSRTQPWRVVLLLAVLSLALTWPLLPHILTHVPGDGIDDPALAWNLWWAKASWVDRAGQTGLVHNPFDADGMFYPVSINLAFYTLTLLNGALSIPLQSAFSLILANNLLVLSSFVIGGLGAYLLALELLGAGSKGQGAGGREPGTRNPPLATLRLAALAAALLYAFASAKLFYVALGQFNIASSQWLPFVALYLARSLRQPDPSAKRVWLHNGILMGLFLALQTWAELTYGSFAVLLIALVTLGVLLIALIRRFIPRPSPPLTSFLLSVAIAAAMFVLAVAPYLANMLPDMAAEGDFLVEGGGFSDVFSADLVGFVLPTQLHPVLGGIIRSIADDSALRPDRSQFQVNKGQQLYLGFSVMLLAIYGLWAYRRRWWAWGVAALTGFFLLVSLGPVVRINGYETAIPGLFPLLLKIPFFQANRYPSRYSVLILLGAGLLAALGLAALLGRLRPAWRKWVAVGMLALLLFEHLSAPLPLSDFRLPPAYQAVAADARPGAILDLPIGWRNGFNVFGKSDTIIMYTQWYQTFHGKPRLGGNTSRNPEHKFQYFLENPVIGVLVALQDDRPVTPDDYRLAKKLAPDLLRFLNLHVVTLHLDKVPPGFEDRLRDLLPLQEMGEIDGVARYEARWPDERTQVGLAAADPELRSYLRQGWGAPSRTPVDGQFSGQSILWAVRPNPSLVLPGFTRPAELALTLYAPVAQTLSFDLAGSELARSSLQVGLNTVTLKLPPGRDGFPRHLDITSDQSVDPAAIQLAPRGIGSTGIASPANIVVRSAGKDTGDFGHIFVDGLDVSPNQRGYNLAAIDPATGALIAAAVFDTHAPYLADESARMAAWIDALPAGTIVAGAVRDAAALNLSEAGWQALQSLGVHNDIRGEFRRAHAFVGVKGAAPGSAADFISDQWPVTLAVGDGLTESKPAFALIEMAWSLD